MNGTILGLRVHYMKIKHLKWIDYLQKIKNEKES